jgi:hypothetical protein
LNESLISELEEIDEDLATEVEEVADSHEKQRASEKLRIGVAAQPQRQPEKVVETLESSISKGVEFNLRLLEKGDSPRGGQDAWTLVTQADQLGSIAEKEFLEFLGPERARDCIILITRHDRIDSNEMEEVRGYACDLFGEYGVPERNICYFPTDDGHALLKTRIDSWKDDLERLRRRSHTAQIESVEESLEEHEERLKDFLENNPDLEVEQSRQEALAQSIDWIDDILQTNVSTITEKLVDEYKSRFEANLEDLSSKQNLERDDVRCLARAQFRCLEEGLPNELSSALREKLENLGKDLDDLQPVVVQQIEEKPWSRVAAPAKGYEQLESLPEEKDYTQVEMIARLAGAGLGASIGHLISQSRRGALYGAAAVLATLEAGIQILGPDSDLSWREVAYEQVGTAPRGYIQEYVQSAVDETRSAIRDEASTILGEAKTRVEEAQDCAEERRRAQEKLEALGRARDAVAAN